MTAPPFLYVAADIAPGLTLREWRRRRRSTAAALSSRRRHRRRLFARVR